MVQTNLMDLELQKNTLSYSELYFSSDQRRAGSLNEPEYCLTNAVQDVKKIRVSNVVVPFSYYVVNSNTQYFEVIEDTGSLVVGVNITQGNYDSVTFPTELKTLLDAESIASGNSLTYTVTIDNSTKKLTISATGNFSVQLENSSEITGFTSTTAGAVANHTGDSVVNLSGPRNLYLRSNIAQSLQRDSVIENNNNFNNVLKRIPTNGNSGDVIYYNFTDTEYMEANLDIANVKLYFTDENQRTIDFNGAEFSVELQLFKSRTVV